MEDAVRGINTLSDAVRQQLYNFQMETVDARGKIQIAADSFRVSADKLDEVWRDCKIAHALGTTGAIISCGLVLVGSTVVAGSSATPFLLAGLGFGVGGALINVGTSCVEASINSSQIKKAEKLWGEALDSIDIITTTVQRWLDKKDKVRIANMFYLAKAHEFVDPFLLNLLQDLVSNAFEIPRILLIKLSAGAEVGVVGGRGIVKLADDTAQAGKAGLQMTDDMAQVGKAGLQASDDVAQTGAKAGSKSAGKYAGKVLIATNIAFLMVDCIDLGFTVRDLVENKGSEAAKGLRLKAKQLEDLLKK